MKNIYEELIPQLIRESQSKIILVVLDGLGGIGDLQFNNSTELEVANIPNLDNLAKVSSCGLIEPILTGITPGSGAAHLSLFGYDPIIYRLKRGVLEAAGIGIPLKSGEIATRANFATEDKEGVIIDRRAGRISTAENIRLCEEFLKEIDILGVKINVYPAKEHRCVVVFSPTKDDIILEDRLTDSDPGVVGERRRKILSEDKESEFMARVANEFQESVKLRLQRANSSANTLLLRGFSKLSLIPNFNQKYKLKSICIANYPMYRGLAKLLGMDLANINQDTTFKELIDYLLEIYKKGGYNFYFLHIKDLDKFGEDGDFLKRVKFLEEFDKYVNKILELNSDVLVITGDHATIPQMKSHSWHPIPFLINSNNCRINRDIKGFSEVAFQREGSLGKLNSLEVMPLILAHANKLSRFGF